MSKLLHARGDTASMFLFLLFAFLGIWQLIVAVKRLNGISFTGYPDRRNWSLLLGIILIGATCGWYFSRPHHFAYPDVEGTETFLLLVLGLASATLIQLVLSSILQSLAWRPLALRRLPKQESARERLETESGDKVVPRLFWKSGGGENGIPILLLHDYGGSPKDVAEIANFLSVQGHCVLAPYLDGHTRNPSSIISPSMDEMLGQALVLLKEKTGSARAAIIGMGFGGTLAINLAARETSIARTVAIDPPAQEESGSHCINVLREARATDTIASFLHPPVRREGAGRVSLARLLEEIPPPRPPSPETVTVIGTAGTWLNSPSALARFTALCGLSDPVLLDCDHASAASHPEVLEVALRALA